ncbi:MAG: MBL fold metallo-hydrolase [Bryobacteraceae bacterium]
MHSHSRRSFLAQTLGASFFGASVLEQAVLRAAQARAQSITEGAVLFDLEKVTEGVYAAVARPTAQINCNAAIFENADDLMIVDTHSSPSAVAALVGQVRREITQKPIRYIVNTHFHADHVLGNPAYRRIAPHAEIVSSTVTRKLIAELDPGQLKRFLDGMPKALEGYRARLAAAKTPEEKAYYEGMVSQTRAYMSEMRDYAPELPNLTFQDNLVLHDKAHDLHLAFRRRTICTWRFGGGATRRAISSCSARRRRRSPAATWRTGSCRMSATATRGSGRARSSRWPSSISRRSSAAMGRCSTGATGWAR